MTLFVTFQPDSSTGFLYIDYWSVGLLLGQLTSLTMIRQRNIQRLFENHTMLIFENRAIAYHQESNFISPYERHKGLSINRVRLYERYPGLARFRRFALGSM
ncbi:MAG: hypothetical protein ACJ71P_21355 [Nitrososphaeraceae archaeon]